MAGQDFAHIEAPSARESKAAPSPWKGILTAVIVVILLMGTFFGGYWIGRDVGVKHEAGDEVHALQTELAKLEQRLQQTQLELTDALKKKQYRQRQAKKAEVGELTFYTELPRQKVDPQELEQPQAGKAKGKQGSSIHTSTVDDEQQIQQILAQEMATPATSANYVLQLASFANKHDAEVLQSRLSKQHLVSRVAVVQVQGVGMRYRVYSQVLSSKHEAKSLQQRLKKSMGLSSLLLKKPMP